MAQYFKVVSQGMQGEGNADQTHQFFNGNAETEGTQVRYILAEDSSQFQTQQLVLSSDQVMVLEGSQPSLQGVVIDQSQNYQNAQPQQFSTVVQNISQPAQQIFFMETNSGQVGEPAVIEQASQPQPIVLNHQLGSPGSPAAANRQVFQGNRARMAAQVRVPTRPPPVSQIHVNQQPPRPAIRQNLPQQVRAPQTVPMRQMMPQQPQMRFRGTVAAPPRPRPPVVSTRPNVPPLHQVKNQLGTVGTANRPMQQKQQPVQQQQPQQPGVSHTMGNSPQKFVPVYQQSQRLSQAVQQEEELDDHDPAMNSSPGQLMDYKKILEQRQQSNKLPILARLPSNIMVTNASAMKQCQTEQQQSPPQHQPQQPQLQHTQPMTPQPQTTIQQASAAQVTQPAQMPQKKPRAPARPRNTAAALRPQTGLNAARQQKQQKTFSGGVGPANVAPPVATSMPQRFGVPQQPRFTNPNQQVMMSPQARNNQLHHQQQQQQQHLQHQPALQQNNVPANGGVAARASQMNYLITAPTVNRPQQQRPLPSYVPSSQIQQIIESTPVAEEYTDSIRMLVLLESGEQRLITFTLPSETCTIQEILRQVKVPFTPDTNIQVTEANSNGINYIVTVGNVADLDCGGNEEERQPEPEPQPQPVAQPRLPPPEPAKPQTSAELPKLIPGKLAVCSACGYTGEDFNKCTRCMRKLPENVKAIDTFSKNDSNPIFGKKEAIPSVPNKPGLLASGVAPSKPETAVQKGPAAPKKRVAKPKPLEESVVISSDEEGDDEKNHVKTVSEQLLNKLGASISISPITKEPSLTDIKKHVRRSVLVDPSKFISISLRCRTIRIGSYRFIPVDDVTVDSKCIVIKAPVADSNTDVCTVRIDRGDLVKVLVCYNKALPVIFCYLNMGCAPSICEMLSLTKEGGLYFDPVDEKEDSYRKITLLPDDPIEDQKSKFLELFGGPPNIDELNVKEANDILIKTCPKAGSASRLGSFSEIKEILMYPKDGQGRLSINTEDYVCLAVDQFLNDKIIDFYLKYLWENLPGEQQDRVHIFSTFFYKRLTMKATKAARKSHAYESDSNLTAAEKRHCRVRNWTKRINLFDKDFIVVPINENAHWFLAIICFPGLLGPQTFDGKPYSPEPYKSKKAKAKKNVTPEAVKEKPIPCEELVLSDKDEAESDSDMCSDYSDESAPPVAPNVQPSVKTKLTSRPPIKQPCILIFDSLAGPSRSRVVATLRDYLTVEYKIKMDSERVFDKDAIKGANCKVPQQTNFTDCGLYVLQYVEQFFKDPIKDYNIPIQGIQDWFEEIVVTKKREDICNLIKTLMTEAGTDTKILPDIALPTQNGKLIEREEPEREPETGEEDPEDMFTDIEDAEMADVVRAANSTKSEDGEFSSQDSETGSQSTPIKFANNGISDSPNDTSSTQSVKSSRLGEFPKQASSKDTLSYLKAKRIVRHKQSSDEQSIKKPKIED